MSVMSIVSGFVTGCAAASILYGVGLKTGWIVDEATARILGIWAT